MTTPAISPIADHVRLPAGPVDLTAIETDAAPGFDGKKADGEAALVAMGDELADLQERLWAERTAGSERRVLVVLQGMDTSGKGGVLRHTIGLVDPQGVRITSFKAPTEEERAHDFLWRIEKGLPAAGYIGVFDRSHYEDVLIARVRGFAEPDEIERRYGAINDFEARLADQGFSIIKCMLHISAEEQKERLAERLANPEKHWKFNPGDLDERALWPAYREAYEIALERTSTDVAPWHVVPSDKKWFRNLAVGQLLLDTLRGLDLQWPSADFDVAEQQARLDGEPPVQ
jgi:PPK2 family polyphosphate:nucleotide phosphotransferase